MNNYSDYFDNLYNKNEPVSNLEYGIVNNHKNNRAKRNYFYRHPNQLRPMTLSHTKKTSHSKQNDLLGAIEMLTYKPPEILPISAYTSQINKPAKLEFEITGNKSTTTKPTTKDKPTVIINQKTNKEKQMELFREKQKRDDALLQKLVNQGVAKVYPKQEPPKVINKKPILEPVIKKLPETKPKKSQQQLDMEKFKEKQRKDDMLLQKLVNTGQAKVSNVPKPPPPPPKMKTQDQLNMEKFLANQRKSDMLLQGLVNQGVATTSTN
tara:strand:- start:229 stop:1026 length:798 start_codon:yes stop_codon:yes gene_type:complete